MNRRCLKVTVSVESMSGKVWRGLGWGCPGGVRSRTRRSSPHSLTSPAWPALPTRPQLGSPTAVIPPGWGSRRTIGGCPGGAEEKPARTDPETGRRFRRRGPLALLLGRGRSVCGSQSNGHREVDHLSLMTAVALSSSLCQPQLENLISSYNSE